VFVKIGKNMYIKHFEKKNIGYWFDCNILIVSVTMSIVDIECLTNILEVLVCSIFFWI